MLRGYQVIILKLASMDKDAFLKSLGQRIVSIRRLKGLNQTDLADLCSKDRQSIDRVEKGTTNPTVFYLREIASALDMSLSELLDF